MYHQKYLKYKKKYQLLKQTAGGKTLWASLVTRSSEEPPLYEQILKEQQDFLSHRTDGNILNKLVTNYRTRYCDDNQVPKSKNILFISHYKSSKIYCNDINDVSYSVYYIKYNDIESHDKIVETINKNKITHLIILLLSDISIDELECMKSYIKLFNNMTSLDKHIMIFYNEIFNKIESLRSDDMFDDKTLIYCELNRTVNYLVKFNKVLQIPARYLNSYLFKKISETWWYQYSINKFFSCLDNRLRQLSATCFANAVLNCVILTKYLKHLFLSMMKNDIDSGLITSDKIDTISIDDKTNKEVIYSFLNKILCKKETFNISRRHYDYTGCDEEDYIVRLTKKLVGFEGIGGYVTALFSNKVYQDIFEGNYTFNSVVRADGSTSYINEALNYPDEKTVIMINYSTEIIVKENYTPCACTITVEPELDEIVDPEPVGGILSLDIDSIHNKHSICGYICNGEKFVYDSAKNFVQKIDWGNKKILQNELLFYYKPGIKYKLKYYGVIYYINNNYIRLIDSTDSIDSIIC